MFYKNQYNVIYLFTNNFNKLFYWLTIYLYCKLAPPRIKILTTILINIQVNQCPSNPKIEVGRVNNNYSFTPPPSPTHQSVGQSKVTPSPTISTAWQLFPLPSLILLFHYFYMRVSWGRGGINFGILEAIDK